MKTFKLWVHQKSQKNFHNQELVINPKEFPNINIGDVVEVYHPEDNYSRLLVQVTSLREDFQQKETISVEQSVANAFQLRTYQDVIVNVVDRKAVALDLVELTFKEQYFSRSDMWRLSKTLINTCVYKGKKVEFAEMRAQVYEMWAKGERMACGVFTDTTKIVFRSSTAVVTIFLQMSSEMWEFDGCGDLYYEKAVGFLRELFSIWKDKNCCHDVTIVMFSRTFYDAHSLEEFPESSRDCLRQDHEGKFYEDFYRVVVQNERYDDWSLTLIELKKLFVQYRKKVLQYHEGVKMPRAWNSTAAQGNFLEVINMSLNAYEKYFLDRNFDRTGKVSLVITPGAGVFEVDRKLTNITKQRVIDYGVGMDIVCMAEQPLHAVPLFRFHCKNKQNDTSIDVGDDYNLPHWTNVSFYHSRSQVQTSSNTQFTPRIKLGIKSQNAQKNHKDRRESSTFINMHTACHLPVSDSSPDNFPFVDYDEYDAQVFKPPSARLMKGNEASDIIKPIKVKGGSNRLMPRTFSDAMKNKKPRMRHLSDDYHGFVDKTSRSSSSYTISIPNLSATTKETISNSLENHRVSSHESLDSAASEDSFGVRFVVGSDSSVGGHFIAQAQKEMRPHRALINPFAPMRMNFKMTSNRRRWIHAFPVGPQGTAIQPHHRQDKKDLQSSNLAISVPTKEVVQAAQLAVEARKQRSRQESTDIDPRTRSPTLTRCNSSSSTLTALGMNMSSSAATVNSGPRASIPNVESATSLSSMTQTYSDTHSFSNASIGLIKQDSDAYLVGQSCFFIPPHDEELLKPNEDHRDSVSSLSGINSSSGNLDNVTSNGCTPHIEHTSSGSLSHLLQATATTSSRGRTPTHGKRLAAILKEMDDPKGCWLGGPTGEQDWSPNLTTGVDWKSMTVPAVLPITTDYFPDMEALEKYFVYTEYSLLPDDYNSDNEFFQAQKRGEEDSKYQHKPLTTVQVFRELIAQRLAQGFQMVILPKVSHSLSNSQCTTLSSSPHFGGSLMRARSRSEQSEEYLMSIGRIFHRINWTGPKITVTRYRPRHMSPQLFVHYRYHLLVPDAMDYDISYSNFCNERLENYNWNYMDHYICTRGENDFGLMESLKYWRSKFYLLPQNNPATKKIIDATNQPEFRCDIYEERTTPEKQQLVEGFLRYLEAINKIRRPGSTRRPKIASMGSSSSLLSLPDDATSRRRSFDTPRKGRKLHFSLKRRNSDPEGPCSLFQSQKPPQTPGQRSHPPSISSASQESVETKSESHASADQHRVRHPSMPNPIRASDIVEMSPNQSMSSLSSADPPRKTPSTPQNVITQASSDIASVTMTYATSDMSSKHSSSTTVAEGSSVFGDDERLSTCSSLTDIVEGMMDPSEGLSFIPMQPGLPQYCFIAGEATAWVCCYVDGVEKPDGAVSLLQQMIYEKLICHASNNIEHPFINGFLLYYIITDKKKELTYNTCFQNEWCEVVVDFDHTVFQSNIPTFLQTDIPPISPGKSRAKDLTKRGKDGGIDPRKVHGKEVNVDVDPAGKSDRDEWAVAQYHSHYSPDGPFSLEVQWIVATGAILGELVYSWVRKASSCGFHFIPVPLDQFALPYTQNSDPLRGPVFIPLNTCCLMENTDLLVDFPPGIKDKRMMLFQESILKRFGFMRDLYSTNSSDSWGLLDDELKYVHCTGGMFALIPETTASNVKSADTPLGRTRAHQTQSLHKEFVARQVANCEHPAGFIWSWNFMLTKRWRSQNTGDETFPDKMLADFRRFCSNEDNRLIDYWDSCKAKAAEEYSKMISSTSDDDFESDDPGIQINVSPQLVSEADLTEMTIPQE
ncbi:GATOR1 complex protein DEPDC5-like [Tubulanus polymorphus]|uniref:GATOR1 complex protein DEPDC5-like n=1 Tax=Tubulanus polymorphus TaxID=672921 RepID=UPI003DA47182